MDGVESVSPSGAGGGGIVYIASRSLVETGTIHADGGAGGVRTDSGSSGGDGADGIVARKIIPG